MLTIHFGDMDGVVYNTSVYFNNTYSGEWFSDPFAQKMIASADKGTVLGPNARSKDNGCCSSRKAL